MRGECRFIRGRLKFGGHKNSAPFPSAVVIFKGEEDYRDTRGVDFLRKHSVFVEKYEDE